MRGFIQIPLLLGLLAVAAIFGGGGYYVATKTHTQPTLTDTSAQASTTVETTAAASSSEPKSSVQAEVAKPATVAENYSSVIAIAVSNRVKVDEQIDEYINGVLDYVERVLTRMKNTRAQSVAITSSDSDPLIKAYDSDIKYIEATKEQLAYYKSLSSSDLQIYRSYNVESYYSHSDAIALLKKIDDFSNHWKARDDVKVIYNEFVADREETDAKYETYFATMAAKYSGYSTPSVPAAPQIRSPQFSTTNCNLSGSYISCQTLAF